MNINPYIYLFFGIILTSPLSFAYFSLEFDGETSFWFTLSLYTGLYMLAALLYNWLQNGNAFIFHESMKWELYESNKKMIETVQNPILGIGPFQRKVIADIYRRRKKDGTYKYKTVPKH